MKSLRTAVSVLALACVATTLSACSGSSSGASGGGGTLVVADGNSQLDTLVPGNTALAFSQLGVLFAPIVAFKPDGGLDYVQASSITGSDGAKQWTIKFRPGWTFHNGEPVTAQSYADGWNLTAYGPNAYVAAGELSNIAGYDAVHPAKGEPTAKTLSGLKVVDQETLQVTLTKPDSQFPFELSQGNGAFYPMPKAGLNDLAAFKTNPIGDGPYQMSAPAKLNQEVRLKRFAGYKGPNPGQIENITFRMYTSPGTAYTDTQAGNVDIALAPQDKFQQIKNDFGDRVAHLAGPSIEYLGFPLWDKRYQDVRVRGAISLAIDRATINKQIFGGQYEPADSLFSSSMLGGSTRSCQYCAYDPAKAKQLLAEAGGWSGGPMTLTYPGGAGYDQAMQSIANQIRQNLGIEVTAKPTVGFSDFATDVKEKKVPGPFRGKWGSSYPSPADTLHKLFLPGGDYNYSVGGYSSPKVTDLITQGDAAPAATDGVRTYQDAERAIAADFPVVPLFYEKFPVVYSQRVTDVHARPAQIDTAVEAVKLK
ncbi:peptide ABC transporter substrate-binding protein [Amycolatopsis jejuensis]|uniref:peptide ABC transporter substrate-binding protein n=1 Tax=Amycolatopsis jejuensis TaxID=330084 RepID=UPI00068F0846|nr:ABC transporter substrate-binding protein [Amycolatopsis jejuensis]